MLPDWITTTNPSISNGWLCKRCNKGELWPGRDREIVVRSAKGHVEEHSLWDRMCLDA